MIAMDDAVDPPPVFIHTFPGGTDMLTEFLATLTDLLFYLFKYGIAFFASMYAVEILFPTDR